MKTILYLFLFNLSLYSAFGQGGIVKGKVVDASDGRAMVSVNIVNLNLVVGSISNSSGDFEVRARVNDTLHFSYLGYKSIKLKVTNDWINFGSSTIVEMTELALALEPVVLTPFRLTGYLEYDVVNSPVRNNLRYSISGLPNAGYEASTKSAVSKVLGAVFNPADFLYSIFGKKPKELRKLRQMKDDDQIRNLLATRFDREMLTELLQIDKVDLDMLVSECDYSVDFIKTANDLQILDAISSCYEEYRVLSKGRNRF